MPLSAGMRLGPYEILGLIGAGGMGEVYKARDTRLDRTVAIKLLPASVAAQVDRRSRFEREAKAIAALDHHIVTIHAVEEAEGVRCHAWSWNGKLLAFVRGEPEGRVVMMRDVRGAATSSPGSR
jgi:serine/threonine protein kinase